MLKGWLSKRELHLRISDNGPGCPQEMLDGIRSMLRNHTKLASTGIGLSIVHRRIRLLYGKRYGIVLPEQSENKGFAIEIVLPLLVDHSISSS
jgi:sensor histidine kinase YesM